LPGVLCFVGGLFLSGMSFAESMIYVPLFRFSIIPGERGRGVP
jgi:hypothetical protein